MAKRFKLRICRVIATTLQSCRSKDPSNLPEDPVPSFSQLPKISTIHFSHSPTASFNHHVSSAFISINCALPSDDTHPPQFKWQKEDKWHVVAKIHQPRHKIYNSAADSEPDDLTFAPPPLSSTERNRRRIKKKKKNVPSRLRLSTSSADSGWFSSEGGAAADEEETETLVSSSPNSSSEFNQLHPIGETQAWPHRRSKKRASKRTKRRAAAAEAEGETPARLSMFKKLIPCTVEGKVKESFAIVKKSEDPYSDFKSSMMDMILEKQMFEQGDLEQLLQCFLSLNSRHYHGTIVEAFSEIWEAIFSPAGSETLSRHSRRSVA